MASTLAMHVAFASSKEVVAFNLSAEQVSYYVFGLELAVWMPYRLTMPSVFLRRFRWAGLPSESTSRLGTTLLKRFFLVKRSQGL